MKKKQVRIALAAGSAALAMILSGCVESGRTAGGDDKAACPWEPDKSVRTNARIAWQKIPNGDLVVKDKRLLESCMPNADISWKNFASGGDVVQAFGSDSVDIGLMGSSPTTIALSAPLNLQVATVWIHDVIGAAESLVAREESVRTIDDLAGKTVGVPFSSTAHYSLLQAIADAGVEDVKLVNIAPDKMPAAWQGDQIDAAWVWDPVLGKLDADGHIVMTSEDTAKAGKPTFDLGAARTDFVKKNPEFMKQWAMAQSYAVKQIKDDPEESAVSISIGTGVDPKTVKKQLPGYTYLDASEQASSQYLGGQLGKDLHATAKFLLAQGAIKSVSSPDVYAGGVDAAPAREASR